MQGRATMSAAYMMGFEGGVPDAPDDAPLDAPDDAPAVPIDCAVPRAARPRDGGDLLPRSMPRHGRPVRPRSRSARTRGATWSSMGSGRAARRWTRCRWSAGKHTIEVIFGGEDPPRTQRFTVDLGNGETKDVFADFTKP